MLKSILNLEGAQKLTKSEQKGISGGRNISIGHSGCSNNSTCPNACSSGEVCAQVFCGPSNPGGWGWDWQCIQTNDNQK